MSEKATKQKKKEEREAKKAEKEKLKALKKGKKKGKDGTSIWGIAQVDATTFPLVDTFLSRCIAWLESQKAEEREGLFRKAGSERRLLELQSLVSDSVNDLTFTVDEDEHVVATLLKRFFRDMKAPLLTHDLYDTFIAADDSTGEERLSDLRQAVGLLPDYNSRVLHKLLGYLHRVASHSAENFMTPQNLAIVFAPNLLRPKVESPLVLISDAGHSTALVATLIEECETFFEKSAVPAAARSEFQKTMTLRYNNHKTASAAMLLEMAKETNLDDSQLETRMRAIGARIKRGDKRAIGLFFDDPTAPASDSIPPLKTTLPDISPHTRVRARAMGGSPNLPIRGPVSSSPPLSPHSADKEAAWTDVRKRGTADEGQQLLASPRGARRIPKSLDLFGVAEQPKTEAPTNSEPTTDASPALSEASPRPAETGRFDFIDVFKHMLMDDEIAVEPEDDEEGLEPASDDSDEDDSDDHPVTTFA